MEKLEKTFVSKEERLQAGGIIGKVKSLNNQKALNFLINKCKPMHEPLPDEWLYYKKETGQTYKQFVDMKKQGIDKGLKVDVKRKFLYIVPLEDVIDEKFEQQLKNFAETFFLNMQVKIIQNKSEKKTSKLDLWKIPSRINNGVKQYNATKILDKLAQIKPQDAYSVTGVLMTDIYNKESWNFVFGLAYSSKKCGVFSFARYNDQFYNPKAQLDYQKIVFRSCKVMVHEICHQFGIKHCIYYLCIMNGSESLDEATNKPFLLCPVCLRKLQSCLEFDIIDRYKKLVEVCTLSENIYFQNLAQQSYLQILNEFNVQYQQKQ